MPDGQPVALEQLADRLITRHLRVSVPDPVTRNEIQRRRAPEPLLDRVRCIAVVGASASSPLLKRGLELAESLEESEADNKAREAELFRLERVYGLDPKDFETRLAALSRTPPSAQWVKEQVSEQYQYRHPTILGYELLAHLLKHRFLDAIISFNFDELLDQSLDDELGERGYRRLVSDRDCVDVERDPNSPDYLPLYIKLHGTASEPDSLRLTRDAYFELPQRLTEVVRRVFKSRLAVIVNVGSAMTGFDLHRLLRIPEQVEIYDLSPKSLDVEVRDEIERERLDPKKDWLFGTRKRSKPEVYPLASEAPRRQAMQSCDRWMQQLSKEIEKRSGKYAEPGTLASLVRFRSTDRHEAVATIFGSAEMLDRWTTDPEENQARYREEYAEYLRERTILELAFSGAKARGLAQLSWLALDRSGTYYDLFRRAQKVGPVVPWSTLRDYAGLSENKSLPDVVESDKELCGKQPPPTLSDEGVWALREFHPKSLASLVAVRLGKDQDGREQRRLARTIKSLQEGSEVEIQATDDQVCAKAFDDPLTLPTLTALRVFTLSLFKDLEPDDEVYISCETGEWLLADSEMRELLARQLKVEVVTAFDFKERKLKNVYGDRLELEAINPWRHNRHMTVVCSGSEPARAVYFARRLRAPMITPVYLRQARDARRVKRAFDLMRAGDQPGRT